MMCVVKSLGWISAFSAGLVLMSSDQASAQAKKKQRGAVRIISRNFDNPCGVAVQPGSGHVFVSTNKRIFRLARTEQDGRRRMARSLEITGFPTDVYGKGPMYNIGPLGLAFLDENTLVVGGGGQKDGAEVVQFYTVGAEPKERGQAGKADDTMASSGPIGPGDASAMGEGNFYAVAIKGSSIFLTCNGDDTKGWVSKVEMSNGKPGPLTPFIATKVATEVDAPTGATISADGKLVVSQLGEINLPGDSLLTYYNAETGKLEKKLPTGLNDLLSLAYSPKTGKLYGLDFSWMDTSKGGLFLLEPGSDSVKTTKIASIDKPTAMTFSDNGTLYITALGTAAETDAPAKKKGQRFPGMLLVARGL